LRAFIELKKVVSLEDKKWAQFPKKYSAVRDQKTLE
jgi:hypothetical protein